MILDLPGRQDDWVLNSGGASRVNRTVIPYLQSQGWNSIPRLGITQADAGHAGGMTNLFEHWRPGELVVGTTRQRSPHFRAAVAASKARGIPIREVRGGEPFGPWNILAPGPDEPLRAAADHALVLWGDVEGFGVVMAPEAGTGCLDRMVTAANGPEGTADVVIVEVSRRNVQALHRWIERWVPRLVILVPNGAPLAAELSPARWRIPGSRVVLLDGSQAASLSFGKGRLRLETGDSDCLELERRSTASP